MSENAPQAAPACCTGFRRPVRVFLVLFGLAVLAVAAWYAMAPVRYRAARYVRVAQQRLAGANLGGLARDGMAERTKLALLGLKEPAEIDGLMATVDGLKAGEAETDQEAAARAWMIRDSILVRGPSAGALEIGFQWDDPDTALAAADYLAKRLVEKHNETARRDTSTTIAFLETKVRDIEQEVAARRSDLERLIAQDPVAFHSLPPASESGGYAEFPAPSASALEEYKSLQRGLDEVIRNQDQLEKEVADLEARLAALPEDEESGTSRSLIAQDLRVKRSFLETSRATREQLAARVQKAFEELKQLPWRQIQLLEARRAYEAAGRSLETFRSKLDDARITREIELQRREDELQLDPMPARVRKVRGAAFVRP